MMKSSTSGERLHLIWRQVWHKFSLVYTNEPKIHHWGLFGTAIKFKKPRTTNIYTQNQNQTTYPSCMVVINKIRKLVYLVFSPWCIHQSEFSVFHIQFVPCSILKNGVIFDEEWCTLSPGNFILFPGLGAWLMAPLSKTGVQSLTPFDMALIK